MRSVLKSRFYIEKTLNRTVTWSYSHVSMLNVRRNLHIKRNLTLQEIIEALQICNENKKSQKAESTAWCLSPRTQALFRSTEKMAAPWQQGLRRMEPMTPASPACTECPVDWLALFYRAWRVSSSHLEAQCLCKALRKPSLNSNKFLGGLKKYKSFVSCMVHSHTEGVHVHRRCAYPWINGELIGA